MNKFLEWFDGTWFYKWFASTFVAHFTFRNWGYTKFPIDEYFDIVKMAKPGEFYAFVSSDYQSLASKLIRLAVNGKTRFTHAGIILFNGIEKTTAMHMQGKGLVVEPLLNVLKQSDYFAVVRIPLQNQKCEKEALDRIKWALENMEKIEYDYEQTLDEKARVQKLMAKRTLKDVVSWYCSELFLHVFAGLTQKELKPRKVLGRDVFDPDSVADHGEVIYSNHPYYNEFAVGGDS